MSDGKFLCQYSNNKELRIISSCVVNEL